MARMTKVRKVAAIEMVIHTGWMFDKLAKNRPQSKLKLLQRKRASVASAIKINKNNDFRRMTRRLWQKDKKNLRLFFGLHLYV